MVPREKSSSRVSYWWNPARVARVGTYLNATSSKYRSASDATVSSLPPGFAGALLQAARHSAAAVAAIPRCANVVWIMGAAD